jgi:hypothetical protein
VPGPDNRITLVIPGLLGPFPDGSPELSQTDVSSLQQLLSRCDRLPTGSSGADFERLLFSLFGYHTPEKAELPIAAIRRLGDGFDADDRYYLCCDPVQLVADQDQVYLTASDELAVTQQEAVALANAVNTLYANEGWSIHFSHPQRWYLGLDKNPDIVTCSVSRSMGYAIKPWLPQGEQALRWHAIMNEIQMLFHSHGVNLERDRRGERLINGLWLWGSGKLPGSKPAAYEWLWSDEPVSNGLAKHALIKSGALPEYVPAALSSGNGLVVVNRLHAAAATANLKSWQEQIRVLESEWFTPLKEALQSGRLQSLYLYPVNGYCYRVSAKSIKRWWRRTRRLDYFVH